MVDARNSPLDADNEDKARLIGYVVGALLLAQAGKANFLTFGLTVLLDILLGALEDDGTLLLIGLEKWELRLAQLGK